MPTARRAWVRIEIGNNQPANRENLRSSNALADELRTIPGVHEVQRAKRELPEGARPTDAFSWGTLLLALAPVALSGIISMLKQWSNQPHGQPTKISIQLGDWKIEGEYDPQTMSPHDIEELAKRLHDIIDR